MGVVALAVAAVVSAQDPSGESGGENGQASSDEERCFWLGCGPQHTATPTPVPTATPTPKTQPPLPLPQPTATPTTAPTATPEPSKPGQVGQPTLQVGSRSITVSWTVPSDGGSPITGHDVRHKKSSQSWPSDLRRDSIRNCPPPTYVCPGGEREEETRTGLEPGETYDVRVRACNANGCGTWSPSARATVPAEKPGQVGQLAAVGGAREITVTWTSPSSDGGSALTGYQMEHQKAPATWRSEQRDGPGGKCPPANLCGGNQSRTIPNLDPGQAYEVRVRACNTVGCV